MASRGLPYATEATFHRRAGARAATWQHEVLAFALGDEEYAVDIRRIREIIKTRPVTEVPRAPAFVPGIISVRGQIIPVIELRQRLRLPAPPRPPGREARVLIVSRGDEDFGLLVDEVRQVVRMRDSDVEPPPAMLGGPDVDLISGIGRPWGDRMLILLDLDAVLTFAEGRP
jgi:purine-binding chemotaxis protein CheW